MNHWCQEIVPNLTLFILYCPEQIDTIFTQVSKHVIRSHGFFYWFGSNNKVIKLLLDNLIKLIVFEYLFESVELNIKTKTMHELETFFHIWNHYNVSEVLPYFKFDFRQLIKFDIKTSDEMNRIFQWIFDINTNFRKEQIARNFLTFLFKRNNIRQDLILLKHKNMDNPCIKLIQQIDKFCITLSKSPINPEVLFDEYVMSLIVYSNNQQRMYLLLFFKDLIENNIISDRVHYKLFRYFAYSSLFDFYEDKENIIVSVTNECYNCPYKAGDYVNYNNIYSYLMNAKNKAFERKDGPVGKKDDTSTLGKNTIQAPLDEDEKQMDE